MAASRASNLYWGSGRSSGDLGRPRPRQDCLAEMIRLVSGPADDHYVSPKVDQPVPSGHDLLLKLVLGQRPEELVHPLLVELSCAQGSVDQALLVRHLAPP